MTLYNYGCWLNTLHASAFVTWPEVYKAGIWKDECEAGEDQDKQEPVCEVEFMLTSQYYQASHLSDEADLQEKLAFFIMLLNTPLA